MLFTESLAKLPYKIGSIKGSLTQLVNQLQEVRAGGGVAEVSQTFRQLQATTDNLCKGDNSLPILAVELQKSCDLLLVSLVLGILKK